MLISILGSTGSIGTQTLSVCKALNIKVHGLSAHRDAAHLSEFARAFNVNTVCITDSSKYTELKLLLADTSVKILSGAEGLCELAAEKVDLVLNAVVGIAGFMPTLAAIDAGNNIALANKETLVAGGEIVMKRARETGVKIIPVDSEHSAIFQCLQNTKTPPRKIILTCSGGKFFGKTRAETANVKPSDLSNPNWVMGQKVTLDSATLMNKGLEFIEAMRLFDVKPSQIEVVIHRESIIHSAVEFPDGALIAQMSSPDMKLPIQYALTYPERKPLEIKPLSLTDIGKLTFYKPDFENFPCLKTAIKAAQKGGGYTCIINAANEAADELFLNGQIGFNDIPEIIEDAFLNVVPGDCDKPEEIIQLHNLTVDYVRENYI
ncbi:MAG: 1-deoxy-D-xylulose-5-phosphate reductoisomerase [Ruminococcus sp.]|jgi:1-deoxy-D-xylulose-5-phosphate reductoisomerase|nr:1-deoxy-D-xylulose-5-phosphate reductoisomerase [Ruminococcus sp.]